MEYALRILRSLIPKRTFLFFQPAYHLLLVRLGALLYRYPSRELTVIGVTGTKGKSTTVEFIRAILAAAGNTVATASTIRFSIGGRSEPNLFKMTMPGRFFLQRFLRSAVSAGATHAVIEMTSEGVRLFRHHGIDLDALVFTNIAPEHIESHGSFEAYAAAKLEIGRALERSRKRPRTVVANTAHELAERFLGLNVENKIPYDLDLAKIYTLRDDGSTMSFRGENIRLAIPGAFNVENALAAALVCEALGANAEHIRAGLESVTTVPGRVERIEAGQSFAAIVDYAHTPDSLRALYGTFPNRRKICVLGNTGGGRDRWKRPAMAKIAEEHCADIILTDEDPYDENPRAIVEEMARALRKPPTIIMDRRAAIRAALARARAGDVVLVSGKGTDPFIMGPRGAKTPWSDARVVREELERLATSQRRAASVA